MLQQRNHHGQASKGAGPVARPSHLKLGEKTVGSVDQRPRAGFGRDPVKHLAWHPHGGATASHEGDQQVEEVAPVGRTQPELPPLAGHASIWNPVDVREAQSGETHRLRRVRARRPSHELSQQQEIGEITGVVKARRVALHPDVPHPDAHLGALAQLINELAPG